MLLTVFILCYDHCFYVRYYEKEDVSFYFFSPYPVDFYTCCDGIRCR